MARFAERAHIHTRQGAADPMKEFLPEGGVVRRVWIGGAAKYRAHLLRFNPQSRRNRSSGGRVRSVHSQLRRSYAR